MTETKMKLEDWLDDLCVRFIINVPETDLSQVERICFMVEEAQWYYEDFIRPLDATLPSMNLRSFTVRIFAHCPLLAIFSKERYMTAFDEFMKYKTRIPVRGAILMNEELDSAVLVKGWKKGANWSFPRGKISWAEDDLTCAMREVYEETGYDIEAAGLVPVDREVKYFDITMREQQMRLYVFKDVPMDTHFEPRTRKEISKIEWWHLNDLPGTGKKQQHAINPNKFYMVAPFLKPLRKWVAEQKREHVQRSVSNQYLSAGMSHDELLTEEDAAAESQGPSYPAVARNHIDTLEGTNEALRALLKIQPQGLQSGLVTAAQSPVAENKGNALLALLQGKSGVPNPQIFKNPPPQTPLEHTITHAPQPITPHHQQPRPPYFSALPPPPTFPIHQPPDPFAYQVPDHNYNRHSNNVPEYPPNSTYTPQASRAHGNPHSYQSPHLVHPQPLPPQVQRAVFNGGGVLSSIPPPNQQYFQPPPNLPAPPGPINPQFPGLHAPMLPPTHQQPQAKLTSHALSLLNAFKSQDQANDTNTDRDLLLKRFTEDPAHSHPPRPQELPAEVAQAQGPAAISLLQGIAKPTGQPTYFPNLPASKPVNEQQRSALLGLFKSPPIQASLPVNVNAATALPMSTTPSAVELSAVDTLSSNAIQASPAPRLHNPVKLASADDSVPEMNPESNLPFRATKILARPPQAQSPAETQAQVSDSETVKAPAVLPRKRNVRVGRKSKQQPSPPEATFQPQILKRPQPNDPEPLEATEASTVASASTPTILPHPHTEIVPPAQPQNGHQQTLLSLLGGKSCSAAGPVRPQPDRRPMQPSDQQQRLLSLFGGPASVQPMEQTPTEDALSSLFSIDPTKSPSTRSRMGSLASADTSRRSSHAPISSADKGFLLNYLDSVAKGAQR